MQLPKNKINWSICLTCDGQGKILRQPSKRRRRRYQRELRESENNGHKKIPKKPVKSNKDLCLICNGSGLSISDGVTEVDFNYPHVAIIGGGIGGTALAVACLHRGIPFTLYERDTSFDSRSQGYGLTLQQASKAIAGLGIISLCGAITSTRHVVFNQEGTVVGEWGIRKWLQTPIRKNSKRKNIHIARQTLRSTLLEQLHETESVKWDHAFVNFSENKEGSIDVNFKVNGKNTIEKADLVVGADGIRSSVRNLLIGDKITPLRYLDCIVILGICPLSVLGALDSNLLDAATVFQTGNGNERIYMMPYDANSIMWQLSFPMTEQEAKALSSKGKKALKEEELIKLYNEDFATKNIIDLSLKLEGLVRNVGRHAGGVVIAPKEITDFSAIYRETQEDFYITHYDKDDIETAGLIKFDLLGLKTLTVIDKTTKLINDLGIRFNINNIPVTDQSAYKLICKTDTSAVFQLESRGMKDLISRLQPDKFEDIIALVALFRPGPLQSGMVDDFIAVKHKKAEAKYIHPSLKETLKPTYGVILYQEQVMEIARKVGGYTLGSADILRRAMGKKKPEEMAK
jgi:hypothetical protein